MQSRQRFSEREKATFRSLFGTVLALDLVLLLVAPLSADDNVKQASKTQTPAPAAKPESPATAEQTAREVLAQFEMGDPGWRVRVDGLVRLAKAGPAAVPVLVDALKNRSPSTREFAAQVLAVAADPSTRPALVSALEDPEPVVRIYALKGLSLLGPLDPTEEPYRRILAKDADWYVRHSLAWALERDDRAAAADTRKALIDYDLARIDSARLDEPAPDFSLTDTLGKTHRLSDFRGKKDVILVFYAEKY